MKKKNVVILSDGYSFLKRFLPESGDTVITVCQAGETDKIRECMKRRDIHLLLADHFEGNEKIISQIRFCNPGASVYYVCKKPGKMRYPSIEDYEHLKEVVTGL